MPPDHGQQVHQALLDPLELPVQVWRGLPQPLDALALEARVVGYDLACPRAHRDQCLRQRGAWILRPFRNPLMMHQSADALHMRAELHRHRSEEHTSELQSPDQLVCRLLLEKQNSTTGPWPTYKDSITMT